MADLVGTAGNDVLRINPGGPFYDRFYGLAGDDLLIARGSDPLNGMYGGEGNDTYSVNSRFGPVIFENSGEGYDIVYVTADNYALRSGQEIELMLIEDAASTYASSLFGNEFAQAIGGNAGQNEIYGRGGADIYDGRGGADLYHVVDAGTWIIEAANDGYDIAYSSINYVLSAGAHVEVLTVEPGFAGAINLAGNEFDQGVGGNDAANLLNGGGGIDTLVGYGGDDIYLVGDSRVVIFESSNKGYDSVYASVSYTLGANESLEILAADDAASTTAINLTGNTLRQGIAGNAGANIIAGGGGADTLIGRAGDDTYIITDASAVVWEDAGEGYDRVYSRVSYSLERTREIEILAADDAASTTALNLTGNEFAQGIAGNAGANIIAGGGGADTLIGRGGDDSYIVTDATARVWEDVGEGRDTVYTTVSYALEATREIEVLRIDDAASSNALNLTGNEFGQGLGGNAGANVLDGKGGADTLVGRGGADSFAFTSELGSSNVDWIFDYEVGVDRILLDDAVFAGLGLGTLSASAFVIGTAAADASDRIIYNSASGALFFDADGSGAGAAVQFATIATDLALTASEFTVI